MYLHSEYGAITDKIQEAGCMIFLILFLSLFSLHLGLRQGVTPAEKLAAIASELKVLQELICKMRQLGVDATEYACLKGIVIFKNGTTHIIYCLIIFFRLEITTMKVSVRIANIFCIYGMKSGI